MKLDTKICLHDHDGSCENCSTVLEKKEETTAEAIRDIYRQEQRGRFVSAITTLLIFAGIFGYCTHIGNEVEKDKQWCREAPATDFVDQFETRCAQYRFDPAIRKRMDRILAGEEK
jgi:hypothetical protein